MKKILCFGDSNTFGYMPFGVGRYDDNTRYPGVIRNNGYEVIEDGVCGRTTIFEDYRPGLKGIDSIVNALKAKYDVIIIMLGSNDYKKNNVRCLDDINSALNKFLDLVDKYKGDSKIILVSPAYLLSDIDKTDIEYDKLSYEISLDAHKVYEDVSVERGYCFLDASKYTKIGIDNCHFTKEDHYKLGMALVEVLNKM